MFDGLTGVPNPADRLERIHRRLDAGYRITDVLITEPTRIRVEALEVIQGVERDAKGVPRMVEGAGRDDVFHLATVDGQPIGKIKVGGPTRSIDAKELQRLHQRRQSPDRYVDLGDRVEASPRRAVLLLTQLGYGMVEPRFRRRHSEGRGEKNSYGQPVYPLDRWRVVEIGSEFAEQAADEIVSLAPDVDDAEERRVRLARALFISPGHVGATAALEAMAVGRKRKGSA